MYTNTPADAPVLSKKRLEIGPRFFCKFFDCDFYWYGFYFHRYAPRVPFVDISHLVAP